MQRRGEKEERRGEMSKEVNCSRKMSPRVNIVRGQMLMCPLPLSDAPIHKLLLPCTVPSAHARRSHCLFSSYPTPRSLSSHFHYTVHSHNAAPILGDGQCTNLFEEEKTCLSTTYEICVCASSGNFWNLKPYHSDHMEVIFPPNDLIQCGPLC